jgi:hypothetical protein
MVVAGLQSFKKVLTGITNKNVVFTGFKKKSFKNTNKLNKKLKPR